jgi:hypothetical protein
MQMPAGSRFAPCVPQQSALFSARQFEGRMTATMSQTSMSRPIVENLETRQFLSASPLPSVAGEFSGQVNFAGGNTDSIIFDITSQRKGSFSGESFQGNGATAKLKGTVNKKGVVHATLHGINSHFSSKIIGAVSGDTLAAAFSTKQGKLRFSGTFSLTRLTSN